MTALRTALDASSPEHLANTVAMRTKLAEVETEHAKALIGGGEKYVARHHERGKLLARERIELLRLGAAKLGDEVVAGQPILWLEAMKMEHQVSAPVSGVLAALPVSVGSQVDVGTVLAVVEEVGVA